MHPNWKERKLSLFAEDMILHRENLEESTHQKKKIIGANKWILPSYEIRPTQLSVVLLNTSSEQSEKEIKQYQLLYHLKGQNT